MATFVGPQAESSLSFEHLRLLVITIRNKGRHPATTNSFPPSAIEVAGEAKCRWLRRRSRRDVAQGQKLVT
jgi:hypothetical protein